MNHAECEFGHRHGLTPTAYCCIKEKYVGADKDVGDCAACREPSFDGAMCHNANNTKLMPVKKNPNGDKRCSSCEFLNKKRNFCCVKLSNVKPHAKACNSFEPERPVTDKTSHAYAREQLRKQNDR